MALTVPEAIVYDERGLVPVIVQDRASGDVLILAYADATALARSASTGLASFWSRSRNAPWQKGETSGNVLRVHEIRADCDRDAVLMIVDPVGPACHTGTRTCFGDATPTAAGVLEELHRVIGQRARDAPAASYTALLLAKGLDHALKKVGEEATEVVLAAKGEGDERLAEECADLLYHLLVALTLRGVEPVRILEVLGRRRRGQRGEA